jgi:hypothetical protein
MTLVGGEIVELLYLPENPGEFIILSKNPQKFNVIFLIVIETQTYYCAHC